MYLRQSTAGQEILLGPFLDSTDGNTQETGLTIANTDIQLWREGAIVEANKNSGGATHIANGRYYAVLDATDSATLGKLEVNVHVTGALAVRREFMVLPANVYDSLVLGTDTLNADVTQWLGTAVATPGTAGVPSVDTVRVGNTLQTANDNGADINAILADTNELQTDDVPGLIAALNDISVADVWASVTRTLTAGTNLNDLSQADIRTAIGLAAANLDTQLAAIPDAAAINAEVDAALSDIRLNELMTAALSAQPTAGSLIADLTEDDSGTQRFTVNALENGPSGSGASAAAIADAVWEEAISDHSGTAGSTAEALDSAGGGSTPAAIADAVLDELLSGHTVAGSMGQAITDILLDTGTSIPASIAALNDLSAADVNAQVDIALADYDGPTNTEMLASFAALNDLSQADIRTAVGLASANLDTQLAAAVTATGFSTHTAADVWSVATRVLTAGTNLNDVSVADILTTQMTESYAADGVAPTLTQAVMLIQQLLSDFDIGGTTKTVREIDGATTAATLTLNDGTNPTGITRAT